MPFGKDKVEKFGNYTLTTDNEGKFKSLAVKGDDAMRLSRYHGHEHDIRFELDRGNIVMLVPSDENSKIYRPVVGMNGRELLDNLMHMIATR